MKSATLELIELAERLKPTGEIGDGMVAQFHELAARARESVWPEKLDFDSDLAFILGKPNFTCIHIANVYRAAGVEIPKRAEAEQAFVIHKLVGFLLKYGNEWRERGQAELDAVWQRKLEQ